MGMFTTHFAGSGDASYLLVTLGMDRNFEARPVPAAGPASIGSVAVAVHDPPAVQIVRRQLDANPVPGRDSNPVASQSAGCVRNALMAILQLDLEHGVRKRLGYDRVQDNGLFLLDLSVGVVLSTPRGASGTASGC